MEHARALGPSLARRNADALVRASAAAARSPDPRGLRDVKSASRIARGVIQRPLSITGAHALTYYDAYLLSCLPASLPHHIHA